MDNEINNYNNYGVINYIQNSPKPKKPRKRGKVKNKKRQSLSRRLAYYKNSATKFISKNFILLLVLVAFFYFHSQFFSTEQLEWGTSFFTLVVAIIELIKVTK